MYISEPFSLRLWVSSEASLSEPDTLYPLFKSISARPLMLMPPIPIKCTFLSLSFKKSNDKLISSLKLDK
jgi:hypothetical protein